MEQYLESLSVTEAEKLKKTILSLFRQTCILQEKYDPVTLVPSDNEQFAICRTHRNFIENYLSVLGCMIHRSAFSGLSEKAWRRRSCRRRQRLLFCS